MLDLYVVKQTGIRRGKAEVVREPHRTWCLPSDAFLDVKPLRAAGSAERFCWFVWPCTGARQTDYLDPRPCVGSIWLAVTWRPQCSERERADSTAPR